MLGFRRVKRGEVKLSRAGKLFVAFTLAVGFAAVNTGNNMLFLLVSMMLALMILSGLAALVNLQSLQVELMPQQLLTVGTWGHLQFRIRNPRPWAVWLLQLRLPGSQVQLARLPGRGSAELGLPYCPQQRGPLPLPDLLLGSSFPFAFVWRGQRVQVSAEELPWVAPSHEGTSAMAGAEPVTMDALQVRARSEGSADVLGLRPRLPNESLHRVLWRRSDWRHGWDATPLLPVLERELPEQEEVALCYDAEALTDLDHEQRLVVLRSCLDAVTDAGAGWRLCLPSGEWIGRGRNGYRSGLWALARQIPFPVPQPVAQKRRAWFRR